MNRESSTLKYRWAQTAPLLSKHILCREWIQGDDQIFYPFLINYIVVAAPFLLPDSTNICAGML